MAMTFCLVYAKKDGCDYRREGDKQYFLSGCIEIITDKVDSDVFITKLCSPKPECEKIIQAAKCVNGTQNIRKSFGISKDASTQAKPISFSASTESAKSPAESTMPSTSVESTKSSTPAESAMSSATTESESFSAPITSSTPAISASSTALAIYTSFSAPADLASSSVPAESESFSEPTNYPVAIYDVESTSPGKVTTQLYLEG